MEKSQSRVAESSWKVHVVDIDKAELLEKTLVGAAEPISFRALTDFSRAVCKVETREGSATGFLATFATSTGSCVHGLFTINYLLSEQHLADDQEWKISFSGSTTFSQTVTPKGKFRFTCPVLDASFIQFGDADVQTLESNNRYFLKIALDWNPSKAQSLYVFQHQNGTKLHFTSGQVFNCHGMDLFHTASTGYGSSGSPVLLSDGQVIAMHKARSASGSNDYNVAVTMKAILNAVRPHFHSPDHPRHLICNSTHLDPSYAKKLREIGLQRCYITANFNLNYFICSASTPIWFVATSHGWYWTPTDPSDEKKETNWMPVSQLDVIDGFENSETLDENNVTIIVWLYQHNIERGICPEL